MTDNSASRYFDNTEKHCRSINCGGVLLDLSSPQVMGVLNVTPDSFSDGGNFHEGGRLSLDKALRGAEQMVSEGAAIIDIGGESTRPGASPVSVQEEMDRVLPVVEAVKKHCDTIICVDTSSPEVMVEAAGAGAGLLNDVRALTRAGAMDAAISTGLPVCLMHMQGQPQTMQTAPHYQDVVLDVGHYLTQRINQCLDSGLNKDRIIIDPGFGFGKTVEHNLTLLNRLQEIVNLGYPVLVGLSRKSLIAAVLGRNIDQRLAGSLALATLAVSRGASIIRVHDVIETVDAVRLCDAVIKESP